MPAACLVLGRVNASTYLEPCTQPHSLDINTFMDVHLIVPLPLTLTIPMSIPMPIPVPIPIRPMRIAMRIAKTYAYDCQVRQRLSRHREPAAPRGPPRPVIRGNHSSNTTCLTLVVFKRGEHFGKLWWSLTLQRAHKTNEAVLDK